MQENPILPSTSYTTSEIPLYLARVAAGFPTPADDFIDAKLDLNQHLITHPASTFFVRVSGHSMKDAGIFDKDLLIVDRSIEPQDQKIVVAALNGELTVKRILLKGDKLYLAAENDQFKPILVTEEMGLTLWGVVTYVIHAVK